MLGWDRLPQPPTRSAADCSRKRVWNMLEWDQWEGMFDRGRMASKVFYRPDYCSCKWVRELRQWFREGKSESIFGSH